MARIRSSPLTAEEVSAVREMVAAAEDSPPWDYATWLEVQVGMMGSDIDFQYYTCFEWVSADGKVVGSSGDAEYFLDDRAIPHVHPSPACVSGAVRHADALAELALPRHPAQEKGRAG